MWKLTLFTINALLIVLSTAHDIEDFLLVPPTFDPAHLDDIRSFEGFNDAKNGLTAFEWPQDDGTPITFGLRALGESNKTQAIIQIAMLPVDPLHPEADSPLMNCYIDRSEANACRSGRENPTCCYERNPSDGEDTEDYCKVTCKEERCEAKVEKSLCSAICHQAMIIQVEFDLNEPEKGGRTSVSSVVKQLAARQETTMPGNFAQFEDITNNASYFQGATTRFGSALNKDFGTGYWIKWVRASEANGPGLAIGRSGRTRPYLVHDFASSCFDCERGDTAGWKEAGEVRSSLNLTNFEPKYWYPNALFGQGAIEVELQPEHVIYRKSQNQTMLGGPCVSHEQCQRACDSEGCFARRCSRVGSPFPEELQWMKVRTCGYVAEESMPRYLVILFVLFGLMLFSFFVMLGLGIYYMGMLWGEKQAKEGKLSSKDPKDKKGGDEGKKGGKRKQS